MRSSMGARYGRAAILLPLGLLGSSNGYYYYNHQYAHPSAVRYPRPSPPCQRWRQTRRTPPRRPRGGGGADYYHHDNDALLLLSLKSTSSPPEALGTSGNWSAYLDESRGVVYYFNPRTGESRCEYGSRTVVLHPSPISTLRCLLVGGGGFRSIPPFVPIFPHIR